MQMHRRWYKFKGLAAHGHWRTRADFQSCDMHHGTRLEPKQASRTLLALDKAVALR
jgi:hypothetical protein